MDGLEEVVRAQSLQSDRATWQLERIQEEPWADSGSEGGGLLREGPSTGSFSGQGAGSPSRMAGTACPTVGRFGGEAPAEIPAG